MQYHILDSYIIRNNTRVSNHFDMLPIEHKHTFLKSLLLYELSGVKIGLEEELVPIAVFDYKDGNGEYWRHAAIREHNESLPDHITVIDKNGRARKKATPRKAYKQGRTYARNDKYRDCWLAVCNSITKDYGIPFLGCRKFEADDIAALLVKTLPDRIVLNTIDKDWLGLVEPGRVSWYSNIGYYPGMRHVQTWDDFLAYPLDGLPMYEYGFEKPSDIWLHKSKFGDTSDSLLPGTPLDIIDLLQPRYTPELDLSSISTTSLSDDVVEKATANLINLGWLLQD